MIREKKIGMYGRVSTTGQRDEGTIDTQVFALRGYVIERGLDPDKDALLYLDNGASGAIPFHNRGGAAALMDDARAGWIDYVLVYSISRLSRNADYDFFRFAGELHEIGVTIRSVSQNVDTGQRGGKLLAGIFALFAAEEREDMMAASREGSLNGAKKGEWQGRTSFGFKIGEDDKLAIIEEEAVIVREIYRMYVEERMAGRAILRHLKETKIKWTWSQSKVTSILSKPLYRGQAYYNMTRQFLKDGKRQVIERPREEWIEIPVPRIIDDETFEKAQFIRQERVNSLGKPQTAEFILPLVECLHCGGKYHRWGLRKKGRKPYLYYRHCERNGCEQANKGILRDKLETLVWAQIEALICSPELWREHIKPEKREAELKELELEKIEKDQNKNSVALDKLEEAYFISGIISKERYGKLAQNLYAESNRLKDRHNKLSSLLAAERYEAKRAQIIEEYLATLQEVGMTSTIEERREIVTALIKRVYVKAEGQGRKKTFEMVIEWYN